MLCRACGGESVVKDSRLSGPQKLRRRRMCLSCGQRWTTYEMPDDEGLQKAIIVRDAAIQQIICIAETVRRNAVREEAAE